MALNAFLPMKCNICNINEANKPGAHIFPAWMIASTFDEKAHTRDYEIIYALQPFNSKIPFFGNSVLPEKINENIGRILEDHEIKNQTNPFVVDNLWCIDCEKRFSIVEEYFLSCVDRKINDFSNINDVGIIELELCNKYLIRLFIYSLIFRADLTNFMGFNLNKKTKLRLKKFLNQYIKSDLKSTLESIENSEKKDQLLKYPIRCIKSEQKSGVTSNFVYVHNKYDKPYCFIINRYIIQFYGKGNKALFKPSSFFGISNIVSTTNNFRNYKEDIFKIALINIKLWDEIRLNSTRINAKKIKDNLILLYKAMYKSKFRISPDRAQISLFLKELTENDFELGIKYTKEKILEAMNKSIINQLNAHTANRVGG